MKIALHLDSAAVSGAERQALLLAAELRRRGHTIIVSSRPSGLMREALDREGYAVSTARPRGDADLWNASAFALWLRRERPDALLLTSWKRMFTAAWAARRAGVPRVAMRLGGTHRIEPGLAGWRFRRALTRYVHVSITNSRLVGESFRQAAPGACVVEVPNGLVVRRDAPAPLRRELAVPDGAPLFAAAGALTRRKGFHLLVGALARSGTAAHLAIAGDGQEGAALRELARSLGVAERVHWLGHRTDVPAVIAAADAYVVSSLGEGMSVAMLEAVAAGVPVLATEVGGVWDVLAPRDGRPAGGWIVPARDETALAGALATVAALVRDDPAALRARADEAGWRLANWFTVEKMVDGYESALLAPLPCAAR